MFTETQLQHRNLHICERTEEMANRVIHHKIFPQLPYAIHTHIITLSLFSVFCNDFLINECVC